MSAHPYDLTEARLQDNIIRPALGLPTPPEDAERAFEILLDVLEEARSASGIEASLDSAEDLSGVICTLDELLTKAREEARSEESAKEEAESALEEAEKKHEEALNEKDADHEEELADLRAEHAKAIEKLEERNTALLESLREADAKLLLLKAVNPWKLLEELLAAATNYDAAVIGLTDHPAAPKIQRDFRKVRDRVLALLQGRPSPLSPEPAEEEIPLRSQRKRKKN